MMKTLNRIRITDYPKLLKKQGKHNDGGSLFLVVTSATAARWEYQYRDPSSPWAHSEFKPAVGPLALSLADARAWRAKRYSERYMARRNGTAPAPGTTRQAATVPAGKTFAEAVEAWLAANPTAWAAKGIVARRGLANLSLAEKDVGRITQADVLAALKGETARQHMEKRGWLKALFSYAKAEGWRTGDNPCSFDHDTRDGFAAIPDSENLAALPWAELPAALKAMPDTEAGNAVRFCLLTGARPGAVEAATWSQIVGENGTTAWEYIIKKGGKPFLQRVPLSKAALKLIGDERGAPGARLFPSLKSNHMLNTFQAVASDDVTLHGTARSTFKMWCDDTAVDDTMSEAALGHYHGDKVHRAYSRGDFFERRRALMNNWADFATGN